MALNYDFENLNHKIYLYSKQAPFEGDGYASCYLPINECELEIHECSDLAFCYNTLESYGCICNDGYEGDGFTCKQIDMCLPISFGEN